MGRVVDASGSGRVEEVVRSLRVTAENCVGSKSS